MYDPMSHDSVRDGLEWRTDSTDEAIVEEAVKNGTPTCDPIGLTADIFRNDRWVCHLHIEKNPIGNWQTYMTLPVSVTVHDNPEAIKEFLQSLVDTKPEFCDKVSELTRILDDFTRLTFGEDPFAGRV